MLDLSKLEAFADDKLKVAHRKELFKRRIENLVGKAKNTRTLFTFLLSQPYFSTQNLDKSNCKAFEGNNNMWLN